MGGDTPVRGKELQEVRGGAKIPPVRLVHTGLTGVEWRVGSGCVSDGIALRVEPRQRHAIGLSDEWAMATAAAHVGGAIAEGPRWC